MRSDGKSLKIGVAPTLPIPEPRSEVSRVGSIPAVAAAREQRRDRVDKRPSPVVRIGVPRYWIAQSGRTPCRLDLQVGSNVGSRQSSGPMRADEEGTHAAVRELRRAITDPKIDEHHGRIVKTTGDGLLVESASVVDAVRCAANLQRAMAEGDAAVAADRRVEFRIGINLGDIILDEGDIFGDGVNVAARLEALAESGGICVSRVVRDQVRKQRLDLELREAA